MLFQRLSACLWTALAVVGAANAYEGDPDVRSIPVSFSWVHWCINVLVEEAC